MRETIICPKELSPTSLNQTRSPDQGNMEGRGLYLLARLNEFLNGHHAILVPVHLLEKERDNRRDDKRDAGRTQVSSLLAPCLLPLTPGPSSLPSPRHLEEALHMLPWGLLSECRIRILAHHVIDRFHDIKHFLSGQERKGSFLRASSLQIRRTRAQGRSSPSLVMHMWVTFSS